MELLGVENQSESGACNCKRENLQKGERKIQGKVISKGRQDNAFSLRLAQSQIKNESYLINLIGINSNVNTFEQGNIYYLPDQDNLIDRILWDMKFKVAKRTLILASVPQLVQLDLTPVCDYSQNKQYVRTIFGVVLNNSFFGDCDNKGLIYYKTPVLQIENQEKFIFFDFRFIKTVVKREIIERNVAPKFKLRKEICTDIQSQLANQINRPGISNV